ncbi:hypothetical protein GF1_22380 [Desulfolithobacter dissulfuricans]|uniref:Uncharacterized protein n=1 Tax=Desulfolithobacter dissulfuricans TaxID=2795293 RepID=A0A915U659_9BACT|nr:hypothetical protein [Desulfolithobacter dissulfuricans]BCO09862.1 hypothetical protein GF1_22380 [Desulfolithobacter dissulfuricans]
MAKAHISPNNAANKTIDAIDRKREKERRFMLRKARDNAHELATALVQRLIDEHIIETNSDRSIRESMEKQLQSLMDMDEFDLQFKVAPIRTLTQDPNFVTLCITQYIIEDLIDHPHIQDIFGDDLDVYRAVDSILSRIRPR